MTHIDIRLCPAQRTLFAGLLFLTVASPFKTPIDQGTVTPSPTTPAPTHTDTASPTLITAPEDSETPPAASPTESATSPSSTLVTTSMATPDSSETPSPSATSLNTQTVLPPLSPTALPVTPSLTAAPSPAATAGGKSFPSLSVMISEVAWAGTQASAHDEWIELHNPGEAPIDLTGWQLRDGDDIQFTLHGSISGYGFYLLERSDDSTVADIPADEIYTGSLNNSGESLLLLDPSGKLIDSANRFDSSWPAGDSSKRCSMERWGGDDRPGNWKTSPGTGRLAIDASGNTVCGTPRQPNAIWFPAEASPTPTATLPATPTLQDSTPYTPLSMLINEIAWAGTIASSSDEWIELYNNTSAPIRMAGWILKDDQDIEVHLAGVLEPYSYFLLERSDDTAIHDLSADQIFSGSLRNSGERLVLQDPSGRTIDTADGSSGWPAGHSGTRASMERLGGDDIPGNWHTFSGTLHIASDSEGNPIMGSPRSPNAGLTPSETPTRSPTPQTDVPPGAVLINEIAWSGTAHSASDEWVELYNATDVLLDLTGWKLRDGNDIEVTLAGTINPAGFFLLERTDDGCIRDIRADQIYHGTLNNSGEQLDLLDSAGRRIDSANTSGGSWPAGSVSKHTSMERRGGGDRPSNWATFTGYFNLGHDAGGSPIQGTPGGTNSLHFPTPEPTWIPGKIVINEVLIRPHYDWQGIGGVDSGDEFIELLNLGPGEVNLRGWTLDDIIQAGSSPYELPGYAIPSGGYLTFFRSRTHIALNDSGDTVHLLDPAGDVVDSISYLRVRAANLSYGRLPDGSGRLVYGLWPTPRKPNLLFTEVLQNTSSGVRILCPAEGRGEIKIPRIIRPAIRRTPRLVKSQLLCPADEATKNLVSIADQKPDQRH